MIRGFFLFVFGGLALGFFSVASMYCFGSVCLLHC